MRPCPHCQHDLDGHRAREMYADVTLMRHRCHCGCVVDGEDTLIIAGEPDKVAKCNGCSNPAVPGTIWCAACDAKRASELQERLDRIDSKVAAKNASTAPPPRPRERRDTDD